MTNQEYAEYEAAVQEFFSHGLRNLSIKREHDRPYFSSIPCECCRRPLAGNRFDCNGFNAETGQVDEHSACPDCVCYAENGRLDDTTMHEIEMS